VWATVTVSVVRDTAGKPDYFIAVAEDISGRKRAAVALRETEAGLRAAQVEVLDRLAQAAELRDDDTGLHTQRVGIMSAQIAAALGVSAADVELIRAAAPLHDVGKIGVPDRILLKAGKLTDEERCSIQRHAEEGARILAGSTAPLTRLAEAIARSHHERWDGKGYPVGLSGDAIPLAARIVAVADVFDALSHDRSYRAAWPLEKVVEHIVNESGTHFDPRVVDAFLRVVGHNDPSRSSSQPLAALALV
jgi:putative two-component system response regulator